ncbi:MULTISPECIES: trypsin-like serine protease [unclassified Okeania]|uniref:trypsin-like serine protease n=1 Tax=unclassified Okeania TaxID=2634635 RepID=UPI0013B91DCC|nr:MULTISPECIES: trypsin-like serine protease [unclassified Okeania]NES78415.1 trypsin-like serine protease [Okeania sp. SIO1H4]NET21715.1 trypsin-like serine protease [Okeania sp. SIO1H5]NET96038.1 trypsin-like serine protease [Okeania sp. SIO1H2]
MASQSIQTSVRSIVINDTAGASTAQALGAPFTSVTEILSLNLDNNEFESACTGSLIASNYILTAQHCVQDFFPEDFSVLFRSNDPENSVLADIAVTDIFQDETFALLDGTDIAILELEEVAPDSIDPLRLFGFNPENLIDSDATVVGFGFNGLGSVGHDFTADDLRWAAENTIDLLDGGFDPRFNDTFGSNIFNLDFDDGTDENNTLSSFSSGSSPLENEGTTAPGDSGSPLLVEVGGELLIAGVLSGGTSDTSEFGDISWFTGVVEHREFIEDVGGEFVGNFVPSLKPTPTPEPKPVYGIRNGNFEDGFNGWGVLGATTIQPRQGRNASTPASNGDSNGLIINDTLAVPANEVEEFLGLAPESLTNLSPDVEFVTQASAIKQTFQAKAGDILTFDFNFLTDEFLAPEFDFDPLNDFSFVSLSSDVLDHPFLEILADVFSDTFVDSPTAFEQETGYQNFSIEIPETGIYTLGLGVTDADAFGLISALSVDNVTLTASASTPEPTTTIGLFGTVFAAFSLLKRKRK